MKEFIDKGVSDGAAQAKGARIETRRSGPKVRKAWVPDSVNLDRLRALIEPALKAQEWGAADNILQILAARGRGYPDLGWLDG